MKTIHKLTLRKGGITKANLPKGAVVLSAEHTTDGTCLWHLGDPEADKEPRLFFLHPTGAKLPDSIADAIFVKTLTVTTMKMTETGVQPKTLVDHLWELPLHVAKQVKLLLEAQQKGGE